MHEIVVNGRFLTRRVTGVERYGREVLHSLEDRCRIERPSRSLNGWMGHAWEQLVLPGRIHSDAVLWSPANTGPLLVRNQVLTIHDLSPLEHPEWFRSSFAAWYRLFLPRLAPRVRRIIVPSDYVKQKVMRRFALPSEKIITIPEGVDASKFRPMDVPNGMERYVLFVGTLEPRKNLAGLLSAWDKIKGKHADVSLVIAGGAGRVFRQDRHSACAERVRWAGYVPEEALPSLYAGADLFVLPSLDEGFGLTALEAMACGTPVLVSDGGALPEVVGEAGMIFSLSDPVGLSNAMSECLSEPVLRASLREKGLSRAAQFSWQTTADSVWKALDEN